MQEEGWTLDELAERVGSALAVDYHGPASGRVRAVPDRRAIRWYTTIGLIDRPVAHRGRTALYGPRHLLQLVAVKRLQARGLPLVSIQQELAGATDTQLARVARLPEGVAARSGGLPPGPARTRAARAGFWREQPAAFSAAATAQAEAIAQADPALADPRPDEPGAPRAATLQGLRLGDGATLLLEPGRELGTEDLQAILDAARPLLDVLRDRGLGAGARTPGGSPNLNRNPHPDRNPGRGARAARGDGPRREHP